MPAILESIKHNNRVIRYHNIITIDHNKSENAEVNDVEIWKHPFIEHLEIVNEALVDQIMSRESNEFVIVSDGGVSDLRGTFGVVLSDGINSIATNKGKVYRIDYLESPFRSEMYALLAGLISLQSIIDTQSNKHSSITLYSDNKKLIERICQRRKSRRTVNQYRGSDLDLELQILEEIKILEQQYYTITLKVVKGHQDLVKSKSSLSHEEILNVWANELAKEVKTLPNIKEYRILPTNNVNLKLNDDYINSRYAIVTKKAYHSIRFHTNESTRTSKYDHKSQFCKQCNQDIVETEDHIIQCLCAPRKSLRSEWLSEVKEFLSSKDTPENVSEAIYYGLKQWLEPTTIEETDFGTANLAMQQQNMIGWRNFVRGRISIYWGNGVHQHITQNKLKGSTQEQWGSQLLTINWKHFLGIWKARNSVEHVTNHQEQEEIRKSKLIEEISYMYNRNKDILIQCIASFELEELNQLNSSQLTTYLYSMNILVKVQRNQEKVGIHSTIDKFFKKRKKRRYRNGILVVKEK